MALLIYILLLVFVKYTRAENCVIDNTPDYIKWEKELLNDLDYGYSSHHAPIDTTIVNITYVMQIFNFNSEKKVMTMQMWMSTMWQDERLKWDPEKHHGINETAEEKIFNVWNPFVGLTDFADLLDDYLSFYFYELKSTGEVHCKHLMLQEAWCTVKLTNWPYDVQECSYDIVTKESSEQTRNITVNYDFIILDPNSAEWYIHDYKHVKNDSTKNQTFTFFLLREAVGLSVIVICPAYILTVLNILSLCLDVRRKVRLAIICFSLLGHYYFLTELFYDLPQEAQFPPIILLYYLGSIVLSVIIILSTFFLAAICRLKLTPHSYVKRINDFVYENKSRTYLVFPRWDFDDSTVDIETSSEDWVKFANILNSAFIFCVVFAYTGLYCTKIPKRIVV